jgi:filamentous hemagglutinin family protein
MAKYKVPSQAASGADTFSYNLVGNQITTGTGQLTNTNFALDSEVIQRDTKNFKTNPFSNFLTLDDLKIETDTLSTDEIAKRKKEIKFKGSKSDAGKSLFGSLKSRLGVSTQNIIINFPAGILIDSNSFISVSGLTATGIDYNKLNDTTQFDVEFSMLYNPFSLILLKPKSKDLTTSTNPTKDF